jgi:hypothetical protein
MKKKRIYFLGIVSYALLAGLEIFNIVDNIKQNDKPKILGTAMLLVISIVAFISFLVLYIKLPKDDTN